MKRLRILSLLILTASLVGCGIVAPERGWTRVVGLIDVGGPDDPVQRSLEVPDTVQVGAPFTARVTTYGSGSCIQQDGAEVQRRNETVDVTPYDLRATIGVCTDDLAPYPRPVELRFDTPGEATVRVLGRHIDGGWAETERLVQVVP